METLPPDPYAALGVTREATSAEIKTAYRKAALRSHPDKAQDKARATDEFHKIQQAYELLSDETERQKYDDQVRLAGLKREFFGSNGIGVSVRSATGGPPPNVEIRTAKFDVRSSPGPSSASFTATGAWRYEERSSGFGSRRSFEEDLEDPSYFSSRTRSKKSSSFETGTRKPSGKSMRPEDESSKAKAKASPKQKERNERQKQRDKEVREETRRKFARADDPDGSDIDYIPGGNAYETPRRGGDAEKERPQSYEDRRSRDSKYSDEDTWKQKYQNHVSKAEAHIRTSRGESAYDVAETPPSLSRSNSYQVDSNVEYRRSSRDNRPGLVRRSKEKESDKDKSAAQGDSPLSSRSTGKERSAKKSGGSSHDKQQRSDTADASPSTARRSSERRPAPPPLQTSFSDIRGGLSSPPPRNSRADSVPMNGTTPPRSGPRRTDTAPAVSSGLRHHEEAAGRQQERDSGYSTSSPSEEPHNQDIPESRAYNTRHYYNKDNSAGENEGSNKDAFDIGSSRRTVLREPDRSGRSVSPMSYGERERSPVTSSRQNSYHRSPAMASTGIGGSSRRPGVSRENSTQATATPGLNRGNSMPIPARTESGSYSTKETAPKPAWVTNGELSSSPTESFLANFEGLGINHLHLSSSSKRQSEDSTPRSRRRVAATLDRDILETGSPASRRASEDLRKGSVDDYGSLRASRRSSERYVEDRTAAANQHIGRKNRDKEVQGQQPAHAETYPSYEKPEKSSSTRYPTLRRAGTMA